MRKPFTDIPAVYISPTPQANGQLTPTAKCGNVVDVDSEPSWPCNLATILYQMMPKNEEYYMDVVGSSDIQDPTL